MMTRPEERTSLADALADLRAELLNPATLVRAVASGRQRGTQVSWRRAELRHVEIKAGLSLQVTTYDDRTAHVRNAAVGTAEETELVDGLLATPFSSWRVDAADRTIQLQVTKKGRPLVHVQANDQPLVADHGHDREKPRMLPADHPVFGAVGITDHEGRIKPSRQSKYRQVDEFLRLLAPAVDDAIVAGHLPRPTADRPMRVVDLGCGNAYLTFAAIAFLLAREQPARMVGVDITPSMRQRNTELAVQAGLAEHLSFETASIAAAELADPPDVVLSLHACDTATDEALARAVTWRAPVILAAPCCHHDIQTQLSQGDTPDPYGLVTRDGILRERFADVLTDALRAAILRLHGYRVDTVQFVESRHTPRNTLLRAIRTDATPSPSLVRDYADLTAAWAVRPALERMLADRVDRGGPG